MIQNLYVDQVIYTGCYFFSFLNFRGDNVEEAFLETAKKIYQSIQDGRLDLNAAESGVQHKPSTTGRNNLSNDTQGSKDNCSC